MPGPRSLGKRLFETATGEGGVVQLFAKNRNSVLLALLLVGAAVLRFYDLGEESLWNDELSSWVRSNVGSLGAVIENVRRDVHPPGYQLLLYYVIRFFGDSEVALRAPSAVAGVLAVFLLYLLGKRLYSRETGLVAGAILAVSFVPIFYAQEARAYSFLLLLSIACSHLFFALVTALKTGEAPRRAVIAGYVAAAVATCYVHYFGLLLVYLQGIAGLILLAGTPRAALRLGGVYLLILFAYVPWLPVMPEQLRAHREFWIPDPAFFDMARRVFVFAYRAPDWFLLAFLAPAFAFFVVRTLGRYIVRRPVLEPAGAPGADLFLFVWIVVPFLASYVQSKVSSPVMTPKNLIILFPPLYLALASVLTDIPFKSVRLIVSALLVGGILYLTVGHDEYYHATQKEAFREAAAFVVRHDENIPIVAFAWSARYFGYYFDRLDPTKEIDLVAGTSQDIPKLDSFLAARNPDRFWFITGHRIPDVAFLRYLARRYRLVKFVRFKGASVRLYQRF